MKKLIYFFIFSFFLLFIGEASAQLNVRAGYANSAWHNKNDDKGSAYGGFSVGAGYDVALGGRWELAPSLNYTYAFKNVKPTRLRKRSTTEHGLSLPVHVKFSLPLSDEFRVYFFAGPGVSYGLGYNMKETYTADPDLLPDTPGVINTQGSVTSDYYTGKVTADVNNPTTVENAENNVLHLNRFDVFAGAGAGVRWNRLFLEAGYDFGLLDRSKKDGMSLRHDQFTVAVGYAF